MSRRTLNDHLVTYYKAKKLSPQLRENLLSVIEESGKRVEGETGRLRVWSFLHGLFSPSRFAYASILLLLGYVAWMVNGLPDNQLFQTELTTAISREIEMNHRKKFKAEFEGETIVRLVKQMDKLDFSLLMPARFAQSMRITGARYCSIRGRIAAQIQMVDSKGRYCTLYQTRLVEPLGTIKKASLVLDGVDYKLWHEKGVFFGFAGPLE
ncbi:MAG: hypothetical protein GY799_31070 [Desulfobulbaceae bacterium]|nr:hypothetical protein [Desulfobulbaceae bacterium]